MPFEWLLLLSSISPSFTFTFSPWVLSSCIILFNAWVNVLISNRFICYEIRSDKHGASIKIDFFSFILSPSYTFLSQIHFNVVLLVFYSNTYMTKTIKKNVRVCIENRWIIFPSFAIYQMSLTHSDTIDLMEFIALMCWTVVESVKKKQQEIQSNVWN